MNANPRSDPRHRLEHVILTKPHTTQKIKDLGVVVSTNPAFVYLFGDGWENIFGSERMARIMVTKEWLQAGIHVTIGSDAPSTPFYTPQATLAGACTRQTYSQRVIGIEHRLALLEALRAHTIEAAYAAHMAKKIGPNARTPRPSWGVLFVVPFASLLHQGYNAGKIWREDQHGALTYRSPALFRAARM